MILLYASRLIGAFLLTFGSTICVHDFVLACGGHYEKEVLYTLMTIANPFWAMSLWMVVPVAGAWLVLVPIHRRPLRRSSPT